MTIFISKSHYALITTHLEAAYPNEGAGLLLGTAEGEIKTVKNVLPFENKFEAGEQYHRYLITADDMREGEDEAYRLGLDVIGVFHSHPDHPAQASDYDRQYAVPWYSYLIASVQKGKTAYAQSWILSHDRTNFNEEKIEIS